MKRKLFFSVAMLIAMAAQAQYSDLYYHRTGDTIEQNPNNGYFAWWEWDRYQETKEIVKYYQMKFTDVITMQKYYTPTPLQVVGIAGIVYSCDRLNNGALTTLTSSQEYFLLYDATPAGTTPLGELPVNLADPHRLLHIQSNLQPNCAADVSSCCKDCPGEIMVPLYEYYFDSAITVTDSFYVGGTSWSNIYHDAWDYPFDRYSTLHGLAQVQWVSALSCKLNESVECQPEYATYRVWTHIGNSTDTIWRWYREKYFLLVYPIVQMDTTVPPANVCIDVEGVQTSIAGDCLNVTWDHWPNYTMVQVCYGPEGDEEAWDTSGWISNAAFTVCGIDTSVENYGIRLRAYCESGGIVTGWNPVTWQSTHPADDAIDHVETDFAAGVVVSPNPASGAMNVESRYYMRRIEMYDTKGLLVYSEWAVGHDAEVDLEGFRAGTYIVVVHTTEGTVAKRLVIK